MPRVPLSLLSSDFSRKHIKPSTGVAALAIAEIGLAEGATVVVTSAAADRLGG